MNEVTQPEEDSGLEGRIFRPEDAAACADAVDAAFDYRGDVTLSLRGGQEESGYLFDRVRDRGVIRLMKADGAKVELSYDSIEAIAFTGRDPASGRSWETWVRKYAERKRAGLEASLYSDGEASESEQ